MTYALIFVSIAYALSIWLLLRDRDRERENHASVLADFAKDNAQREINWENERQNLLDRIQAPERAAEHALLPEEDTTPPHVPFDDDGEFQQAYRERMSDGNGN